MRHGDVRRRLRDGLNQSLENPFGEGVGDVAIAGGARTVRQYLAAGLIDELRLHIVPVVLGAGERLSDGVGELALEPLDVSGTSMITHVRYRVGR